MNILPKKKWHVRTKENMARVRRDEAEAAAIEAAKEERATIAENEARIRKLKGERGIPDSSFDAPTTSAAASGHVNFFEDEEKLRNHDVRNKEAEKESKKELDDHEHKLGIKIKFGELTDKPWYDRPIERPYLERDVPGPIEKRREEREAEEKRLKKEKKHKKKEKKRQKQRFESDDSDDSETKERRKKAKLAELREERLARERAEKRREFDIMHPEVKAAREAAQKRKEEKSYSSASQFNPHLAKQNRCKH
uniref:Cir_N domain-containing protein n=1 Tax=Panagrellus redivivus TaxID=6233 RepID=A0A7E4VGE9_PANRE